jgi:energy-coupling factor transporter ATP-binding protein EcfA2
VALARLTAVSYWFPGAGTPALGEVTLDIEAGLTLVAGPSGGGKSTLLRVLNGLVPHFHGGRVGGRALVDGRDVWSTPTRTLARSVGFVFQDPELQSVYSTVEREVAFGLENLAVPAGCLSDRVDEALDTIGAGHLRKRRLTTLSGGERQRVAIASAIALRPRLLALDEPTSQLDGEGATLVLEATRRLAGAGLAVIIAEHRLEGLAPAATAMLALEGGRAEFRDPVLWQPEPPARRSRQAASGDAWWSLRDVDAGFDGRAVVASVTLSGQGGEVVVLQGPNGGGKTTLLRVIAGVMAPTRGRAERARGRVAYLPQNPSALLHRRTLLDEVRLTLERAGDPERPEDVLRGLGLLSMAGRYPRDLATGERQRAALAAVLAGTPALVVLDEPTRGMDSAASSALCWLVGRLRARGSAIVLATHDRWLTEALADRIVRVSGGVAAEVAVEA